VTYHQLYHAAAAEAKLRFRGAKDLQGAKAWLQLRNALHLRREDPEASVKDELMGVFRRLDRDRSGFLTQAKLQAAVMSLGLNTSEETIQALVLEATGDMSNDEVDYQTLVNMVSAGEGAERRASKGCV